MDANIVVDTDFAQVDISGENYHIYTMQNELKERQVNLILLLQSFNYHLVTSNYDTRTVGEIMQTALKSVQR